jgi:hypothetical protein
MRFYYSAVSHKSVKAVSSQGVYTQKRESGEVCKCIAAKFVKRLCSKAATLRSGEAELWQSGNMGNR